ncbi:hypothetical protein GWI33_010528 [Rhynchophorus ferrugineus]|uniref:Uncharacterized protein n=1 Tax=Rhynchophorus ferrugineus TaxID=354439 RepID=A0A834IS67_RHYFE|nr:hypothetical protein GWI33_010528 [Rhynchophorus ferrugineus]
MTKVCRLCLVKLQRGSKYFNINAVESFTGFMPYRDQLTTCIPEMALDLIPNPVICNNCRTALKSSYVFKSRCLLVEKKIRQYVERQPGEIQIYNLAEIDTSTLPKPAKYESEILRESAQKKPIPILPKVENQSEPVSLLSNLLTAKSEITLPNTSEIEITNVSIKSESFEGKYEESDQGMTELQMKQMDDDEQGLSCNQCDRKFCSVPVLHSHKTRVHEEDYICNFCGVSFRTLQSLRRHNQQCQKSRTSSTNTVLTKRPHLPTRAKNHLKRWLFKHTDHPYPTDLEKQQLMKETNLSLLQVENWFINARRRILADLTKLKILKGQPTRGRRKKLQHSQLECDYEDLIEGSESETLFEDILVKRDPESFEAVDNPLEIASSHEEPNAGNRGKDSKVDILVNQPTNNFMDEVEHSEEDPLEDVPLSNIAKEIKLEIQVEER